MTDNPTVNRYLADKAFDHMDHALGRPVWPSRDSYRNYFATRLGGNLWSDFSQSPHWEMSGSDGQMSYFHVTDAGKQALADYLAKNDPNRAYEVTWAHHTQIIAAESPAKAKYKYYLAVSDVMPDIRFVDFSRDARVRRAA